jgi:hypothetical protein
MLVGEALGSFEKSMCPHFFPFYDNIDMEAMRERPYHCLKETLFLIGTCPASPALQGGAMGHNIKKETTLPGSAAL